MLRTALSMILLVSACGSTATIYRYHLPSYEARVVDSDAEAVIIEDEQGGRHRVPRTEITGIDHPGDGAAITGIVLLGFGALGFSVESDEDDRTEEEQEDAYVFPAVLAGSGALLLLLGGWRWWSSRSAAARLDPPRMDARPGVQPPVVPLVPLDPYAPRF